MQVTSMLSGKNCHEKFRDFLTSNDLGTLKVLVWMDIARPESKVYPH